MSEDLPTWANSTDAKELFGAGEAYGASAGVLSSYYSTKEFVDNVLKLKQAGTLASSTAPAPAEQGGQAADSSSIIRDHHIAKKPKVAVDANPESGTEPDGCSPGADVSPCSLSHTTTGLGLRFGYPFDIFTLFRIIYSALSSKIHRRHDGGTYPVPQRIVSDKGVVYYKFSPELSPLLNLFGNKESWFLYDRPENRRLAGSLDDLIQSKKHFAMYIFGPPGIGKSMETLLWALLKLKIEANRERKIAWIKLDAGSYLVTILSYASDEEIAYSKFHIGGAGGVDEFIKSQHPTCDIVIFDNVTSADEGTIPILGLRDARIKLVMVSSLPWKPPSNIGGMCRICLNGWTEEEYQTACGFDDFYNQVKKKLKTDDFSEEDLDDPDKRRDIVAAKFSIGGCSARWTLQFTANVLLAVESDFLNVLYSIDWQLRGIDAASVERGLSYGPHASSPIGMNYLLSSIGGKTVFVSKCVASKLAERYSRGPLKAPPLAVGNTNPGVDGVLMEMDFVMCLGQTRSSPESAPVTIELINRPNEPPVILSSGAHVHMYRINTFSAIRTVSDGDWFVPLVSNDAGFDCVQYENETLRFVQVTHKDSHSYNLTWHDKFYTLFTETFEACKVVRCEVYFVVQEVCLPTFEPEDCVGTLTSFDAASFRVVAFRRTSRRAF